MQVGASIDPLQGDKAFVRACYGFVVFSIVSVGAVVALVGVLFTIIYVFNMVMAIGHAREAEREREKLADEKLKAA